MRVGILAGIALCVRLTIVVFVVGALVVGNLRAWRWVNRLGFRLAHLSAIGVVVAEAWQGVACPLTSVETWLRTQARAGTCAGSFIEHWLHRLLYDEAPAWVSSLAYSLFGRRRRMVVLSTDLQTELT